MKEIHRIRILPEHVANKIAAGEVVERPASVLKELLENSLDAETTQIDAEIVSGGRKLVQVSDNGIGMSRDDALLSIERFATSKIRDVDEIERIATLGFRGEALAAISAVSRFCLQTRRAQDLAGTEIIMSGGQIQDVRDQGCAPGTVVAVRNLFFNIPARRKFLRSEQTELSHIRQVFMLYALSHPDAAMSLTIDGRQAANLPGHATLDHRLRDLYPSASDLALRAVNYASASLSISGYASLPTHSRSNRSDQYLFINGRPTGAPVLAHAIREAYHSLLPKDRYPMVFLFITLDPSLVDVNVHPTKKEVRFHNPAEVRDATIEAIRRALASDVLPGKPLKPTAAESGGPAADLFRGISTLGPSRSFPYPRVPHSAPSPADPATAVLTGNKDTATAEHVVTVSPEEGRTEPWSWMRVLGQVGGLYVVMETEEGLVLMDPHAAHERVLYERFMTEVAHGRIQSHGLLMAETVELTPKDALILRRHIELLRKMGFGIAEFGGDTFVVDALPACVSDVSPVRLLTDLTASLEEAGESAGARQLLEERVVQAACKSAVKALKPLAPEEIEGLVGQLARTEMPYTCPHGRPTLIHISWQELDKKFGRA